MRIIKVPVRFEGVATVQVPDHLNDTDALMLAQKVATATILATSDNPDCGEALECAWEEFDQEATSAHDTQEDFDSAKIIGMGGMWVTLTSEIATEA